MSFDFSQFKGVHKVTKKPERVWVGMGWTMKIPNGFTYSVDPEKTGHGAMGTYLLRVQDTANWDDSESYSGYTADFNVVVYGRREITTCLCDDMSSTAFLESLDRLPTHILGEYQVFKRAKDILILYRIDNEDEDYTMYSFQVASRGSNLVYTGQFNCKIGDIAKRRNMIFQWLGSIGTLSEEERLSYQDYSGTIKSRIQPVFNNQSISIGQGITVEVPHGFHSETNPSQLGENRCLVIVPENYSFHDDPMEAPIALTVISPPPQKFPTNEALIDQYLNFFCRTGNAFRENAETFMFKHSGKSFSLSQLALFPDDAGALSRTALFVNEHVYIITIVINHTAADYDLTLSEWDIHRLTNAWVGRIHIEGEEARSSLPQATPSLELYPHYDSLGDTSKPKAKAVGSGGTAIFITNAGGTEFESYPVSRFDGELKAVAERAVSKDSCSKEYRQLVSTAINYAALFRVDKTAFNFKEDRECDIRNLNMRRSYQLHILRSFAWTLAEAAETSKVPLAELSAEDYQAIFPFIEQQKYLNYQDGSHFPTLCGTADLHVFFVPDKTSKADKDFLIDSSGEVYGNIIPHSVASLDGLRKDLLALSDPMEKLFQWLLSTRDYSKPLTGVAADALYAWCTMVLSAETPFFIEDGPMTCRYTQITEPPVPQKVKSQSGAAKRRSAVSASPGSFPVAEVSDSQKKLLNRKPKKTDGLNYCDLHLRYSECSSGIALYYYDKVWPGFASKKEELLRSADEVVKLFRDDSLESDVESELRRGYIRNGRTLHVLRSFVWTSVEYCKNTKEELADFGLEQSIELAQFIFDRGGANYKTTDKNAKRIGAGLLTKSEKNHSYSGESYVFMVHSLHALMPVMKRIHTYLSEKQGELSEAETTLKDILAGWCAFSLACITEFDVEGKPTICITKKNHKRPVDKGKLKVINGCYYVDQDKMCIAYTGSGETIEFPEGVKGVDIPEKYRDISGSREFWDHKGTIIFPESYTPWLDSSWRSVNSDCPRSVKRLVFKGKTNEIKTESSFKTENTDYLVWLEEIEFLGSGNTISSYAFSSYQELRKIVLPENLSVIKDSAFSGTTHLKEIRIPPNVIIIGKDAFKHYDGNTTVLIVEKGSPAEAVVSSFVAGRKDLTCRVVLSPEEQAKVDEENRLKQMAAAMQKKLLAAYSDRLQAGQFDDLKNSFTSWFAAACDKKTWAELCQRGIPAIPTALLKETNAKITSAVSAEEAYDQLPEWIAAEFIKTAEEARERQAFERIIRNIDTLARRSILSDFERGVEKNVIVGQCVSEVKSLLGDGAIVSTGLVKYVDHDGLRALRLTLRQKFDSTDEILYAIMAKKSAEYDRLAALLQRRNTAIASIQQESANLQQERSRLGLFQGKRKKEIAALLEAIPARLRQAEDEYEAEKSKI